MLLREEGQQHAGITTPESMLIKLSRLRQTTREFQQADRG